MIEVTSYSLDLTGKKQTTKRAYRGSKYTSIMLIIKADHIMHKYQFASQPARVLSEIKFVED